MSGSENTVAYAHDGHRLFNERLGEARGRMPANDVVEAPWLSNEAVARLPRVQRDFDMSRDPFVAAQLFDLDRAESQRAGGRASVMVREDRPKPEPRPPRETGRSVDASGFRDRWLVEQRDAAMANARPRDGFGTAFRDRALGRAETDRARSR